MNYPSSLFEIRQLAFPLSFIPILILYLVDPRSRRFKPSIKSPYPLSIEGIHALLLKLSCTIVALSIAPLRRSSQDTISYSLLHPYEAKTLQVLFIALVRAIQYYELFD